MSAPRPRRVSCGVLVTDGHRLLLGHASRSPRWDIPKGLAEPGEALIDAAVRELKEETGLVTEPTGLIFLGLHPYLREKDLALFGWRPPEMPAPDRLHCSSFIERPGYARTPELDRFGIFAFETALAMVGKNLARVLKEVWPVVAG
jgi:putative (di)nucleoside polyphosphate hydrolase